MLFRSFLVALGKLKWVFLLLIIVILTGTILFQSYYSPVYDPQFDGNWIDSIFATVSLMFAMEIYSFPFEGPLIIKLVYGIYPFLGMIILGVGLLEFSIVVFTQRYRIAAWNLWMAKTMESHTVLVGLGNVGTRILQELRSRKILTSAITLKGEDEKHTEFIEEILEDPNVAVVFGNAMEKNVLKEANVAKARAIIIVTNDDLVNFRIAVKAKEINPSLRTIIRVFDRDFAQKVTKLFDVDAAISTSAIAAPAFVATSYESGIIQTLKKGDSVFHLMELKFIKSITGDLTVEYIENKYEVSIIAVDKEAHPESGMKIKTGSTVLLLGELDALRRIRTQFCV